VRERFGGHCRQAEGRSVFGASRTLAENSERPPIAVIADSIFAENAVRIHGSVGKHVVRGRSRSNNMSHPNLITIRSVLYLSTREDNKNRQRGTVPPPPLSHQRTWAIRVWQVARIARELYWALSILHLDSILPDAAVARAGKVALIINPPPHSHIVDRGSCPHTGPIRALTTDRAKNFLVFRIQP
jgi:hypothetical protein